ncbi:Protein of unknown function [Pyronema omphalodes CBS 100304]|uniref:Uncharacterized protein n=1 Tax=Pyronema omphalodes (strain CBS 100304) TaxID=1076935 RepID=U4LTJ8_PYROM|nr:Protein of unknown function [Pyronema omphalodes CBS 100304]
MKDWTRNGLPNPVSSPSILHHRTAVSGYDRSILLSNVINIPNSHGEILFSTFQ